MTEDNFYVTFVLIAVLFLILLTKECNRKFCIINFILLIVYSSIILILRNYNSEYGKGLAWLFFLFSIILSSILICYIFLKFKNKSAKF
ncbi:hypothetical protein Celal_3755 [Cellulophaga algicola DSM 14237]|uniref:Uncharacterized protein n=1 Tax=Cellulophaga algicola (strain DSM 14237 / IC166 / ACAM 630) TaxID=688270 RepID=E6XAP2_CELAD|nr:hypothetical protein Celal_3755 [Cellulophaga algicola DSM 14237]